MEKIKDGSLFVSVDGDSIGAKVGRAVLANDVDELHKVSARIDAAQDLILHWCKEVDGTKISGGGDEATMAIPPESKDKLEALRQSVEKAFDYTLSVGVGKSLSEAGTALLVAKLRGKNRIVVYNEDLKKDIKKAKRRVREGRASQEEYKLSEAYLEKSEIMAKICSLHKKENHKKHVHELHKSEEGEHKNPAGNNEDARHDDCAMCQDLDAQENADGTAGMDDCPMCQEMDGNPETDDCPMCQEMDAKESEDDCPMCQEMDAKSGQEAQPEMSEASDGHPDDCPECNEMFANAIENQPGQTGQEDPNLQGHETAEEILDMLDQEPGSGAMDPTQEAKQIDNTEMPQGDQMKENVSVKDNFGQAQKEDISDADKQVGQDPNACPGDVSAQPDADQPDIAGVLQDGLDEHAQDQKKQQVLSMVAQTLQGFKANKEALEASKEQNAGLYSSCIQMLKAMIELCKLLGLEPPMPAQAPAAAPQASAPAAPNAAPSEGAAQDPKTQG